VNSIPLNIPVIIFSLIVPNAINSLSEITILKANNGQEPEVLTIEFGNYLDVSYKEEILKFIGEDYVFVYDLGNNFMLKTLLQENFSSIDYIDVKELLTIFYPSINNSRLENIVKALEIDEKLDICSDGYKEVKLIYRIVEKCWNKGLNIDLAHLYKLEEATKYLSSQSFVRNLRKEIQRRYFGETFRPVSDFTDHKKHFAEKEPKNDLQVIELNSDWIVDCFRENGLLSKKLAGFEVRTSQILMVEAIIKGFTESVNTIIEAGTGTGKSISYLIPALWWARRYKQKVIVATHTLNLQEQLFFKDLPFLKKILPFSFKTQLLKGKGNYLCLKEFNREKWKNELMSEERLVYAAMFSWIKETTTGDLNEIAALHNFYSLKNLFGAENTDCQPRECYYARDCFLLKAKKLADEADLVIVNHSLLIADIKTNNKVIPEYNYLIIDEAHNFYQTALKQLSFELSLEQIVNPINKLLKGRGSLLTLLQKNMILWSEVFPLIKWEDIDSSLNELTRIGDEVIAKSKELFAHFSDIIEKYNVQYLNIKNLDANTNKAINIMIENLLFQLNSVTNTLSKLTSCFSLGSEQFLDLTNEINKIKNEFVDIVFGLDIVYSSNEIDRVTYLEKTGTVYLKSVQVDIANILKEKIFDSKYCTILTSATLSIEDNFEYIARDIGLDKYNGLKLDSVFDFDKQMLLAIVNNIPISCLPEEQLVKESAAFIGKVVEIMDGRTLVLFTSHRHLRLINRELKSYLDDHKIRIYAQGIDGAREKILKEFTTDSKSVLLGTNSFWEGIDLPGENLKCVIITRLPFWPPDNPIIEAKANLIAQKGKNPFEELHLPEAIIRLKQGFGRLIRSKSDRGVVIILDDRLLTKSYGKKFLKSLPITSYFQGNTDEVLDQIKNWI